MGNTGWITVFVGSRLLMGTVGMWEMLRGQKSEHKLQERRNSNQGLAALGSTFVVLGIVFGMDRLIGYSFIGAGVLLSIIGAMHACKKAKS